MNRFHKQIFAIFAMRYYNAPEGQSSPGGVIEEVKETPVIDAGTEGAEKVESDDAKPSEPQPEAPYVGSKELNPTQRPLKLDVKTLTKDEVDELIKISDPADIFMSDEDLAKVKKPEKEEPAKKEADAKADAGKEEKSEDATKAFYEKTGITEEEFKALPEKIQEKLAESFVESGDHSEKITAAKKEFDSYREDVENLMADPIIAARVQEIESGKQFVARDLPKVTDKEIESIDNLLLDGKKEEARTMIDKLIKDRAAAAIETERAVHESKALEKALRADVGNVFRDLMKMDKRLALDEQDVEKLNPSHKEWNKFEQGLGDLKKYCIDRGFTMEDIKRMGAKELYAAYSTHKGWDKEREQKIYKNGAKELLKSLQAPKTARTLDQGPRSGGPVSEKSSTGFDRQSLVAELVAGGGHSATYNNLLKANDGNDAAMQQLFDAHDEALRQLRARK